MGIGSIARAALGIIVKHPVRTACVAGVGGVVIGLIANKAKHSSQKEAQEQFDRLILSNPILNPIGCWQHAFNVENVTPQPLDNPALSWLINNRRKAQYYTQADSVKEFYENGGRGVRYAA